jgi:hypothetical protein
MTLCARDTSTEHSIDDPEKGSRIIWLARAVSGAQME